MRKQTNGDPLPSARNIQLNIFLNKQSSYWDDQNILFMEWGQLLAHDTSLLISDNSGRLLHPYNNRKSQNSST